MSSQNGLSLTMHGLNLTSCKLDPSSHLRLEQNVKLNNYSFSSFQMFRISPSLRARLHQVMTLAILFSLETMESLENRLKPHSGVTPLFSMTTELQASSQSCCSVDADACCKQALNQFFLCNFKSKK